MLLQLPQLEQTLTDALEHLNFRTVVDAAADAMLLVDNAGHILLANPAAQSLFGYSEDELSGLTVETLMPPQYRKQHRHHRELFSSKPEKRPMSYGKGLVALNRSGKEMLLDIGLSPIKVQEQLYILVSFSVAERRLQVEDALRASEERLRLAKQAANLGIYDCDCKRQVIYMDEKMRELWGCSDETLTYEEFMATIHPQDRATRQAAFDCATDTDGHGEFNAEYRIINPANGAERWIASAGRVYFENGCAHRLLGVIREVTEQKKLQKKLQAQRDETENLLKQQVAARTASAIAHELNQPLTAISAYSEVALHALHGKTFNADNLKRSLEGCVEQAQRAGRNLHELLVFLQIGEIKTERLDLNDLINEALDIARNDGYGEFYPILQLEQNLPAVKGNRTQIQKVLVNLFRNAVEAMRAAEAPTATITISMQTLVEKNMVLVTVQDSGAGLNPVMANYIFETFFSNKPNGIGMGLAISRALIESNGGQLWVDPEASPGAKFHFTLPFAP